MSIQALVRIEATDNEVFDFLLVSEEYRIDSRDVAPGLGIEHESFMKTLRTYQSDLEHFGILRFEIGKIKGRGHPETYVMLNRNQVLFAITLSRNTEQVVMWKKALIDALDQLEKQQAQPTRRLAAPRQSHTGKGSRGPAKKTLTLEELDRRIIAGIGRYEQRHGQHPSASDIKKFYLRYNPSTREVKTRIEALTTCGSLKEIDTLHTTRYTLVAH